MICFTEIIHYKTKGKLESDYVGVTFLDGPEREEVTSLIASCSSSVLDLKRAVLIHSFYQMNLKTCNEGNVSDCCELCPCALAYHEEVVYCNMWV